MSRVLGSVGRGPTRPPVPPPLIVLVLRAVVFVSAVAAVVWSCGAGLSMSVVCESLAVLLPVLAAAIVALTRGRVAGTE
ncbi:hypothetical protein HPO96_19390 [Kribbella sandramycini]|uniref:Uncharacterized protein n=1 Tax=Kribbella sandramycini TaxID=60450 RepID=A0A7Y4L2W4_9ACTN|nr:hypothetical protein [Kribbella sandramycini]MBB6564714.1 hypothetical protein [Kribbella sandramycini]NOL42416.1 hypothetical protein [Kribbella sandramycini]